jgi:aminopeptidase
MKNKFNERFSRQVVEKALRVSKGENVYISTMRDAVDLAEAIALECDLIGAKPLITTVSDEYLRMALVEPEESYVESTPKHQLEAVGASDVYIGIGKPALSAVPMSRIGAWRRSRKPVGDRMDERGTRWVAIAYPTEGRAKESGVPLRRLEKAILSALDIDYSKLGKKGRRLTEFLANSEEMHLTSPLGTNLVFSVKGRKWIVDDGVISKEDVEMGDVGLNLPCGEVFVCPREDSANGTAFFDVPSNYYGHRVNQLRLEFEKGRVIEYDAEEGRDDFEDVLNSATGDKDRIGEFAIGLNPNASFVTDILVDEKVLGSIHIAIGNNKGPAYGGQNDSSIHWDLIMTKPTVVVDGRVMMKDGKIKI